MTKVFSLSLLALLTTATIAQAESRHEVSRINELHFDGQNLSVGYGTGGGCEKHTPAFELKLNAAKTNITVKLVDVTPKPDFCEAYLYIEASVDLAAEIRKLASENNLSVEQTLSLDVILPKVQVKSPAY